MSRVSKISNFQPVNEQVNQRAFNNQSSRVKDLLGGGDFSSFDQPPAQFNFANQQQRPRDRSNSLELNQSPNDLPAGKPAVLPRLNSSVQVLPSALQSPLLKEFQKYNPQIDSRQDLSTAPQSLKYQLPPVLQNSYTPTQLQQPKLAGPPGLQQQALLQDLDLKFENQDKMINFMMQQIQQLEMQLQSSSQIQRSNVDVDRDNIIRIKSELRQNTDVNQQTLSIVQQRLTELEQQLKREESVRIDLQQKLRISEAQSLELASFIKSLSNQSEQELNQMRSMLQSKVSEDHLSQAKTKEKNAILMQEVVRLSQQADKHQQLFSGIGGQIDERIVALEQRLALNEQSSVMVNRKGDAATQFLNDIFEKMESKLMQIDQTVAILKMDQYKEKENLGRVEVTTLKNSDEFRNMLNQLNGELSNRLEIKLTDLVNRLLSEQEERSRAIDDVKYTVDMKDRMNQEKTRHQTDELRDRYNQMDSIVRAEFQRKDQVLAQLQNNFESQIRSINGWIKQEELARAAQEVAIRSEVSKVSDAVRYEIDGFKNEQVQITDKISEMIRVEVDQRLQSDKDTKLLVQNLLKNIMTEVGALKDSQDSTIIKLLKDVKDQAQDSAERAHFLSRYIDEEIAKIGDKTGKQVENLKVLCAKLTEQFKKHLINHESMKKDLYKRFEIIESHLPVYRSELNKMMESSESRSMQKMKELKDALSNTILTNFTALDDRVDQFSELVDSNLETLRRAVGDNREVFVSIINKNIEEQRTTHDNLVEDMEKVIDEVFQMRVKAENGEKKVIDDTFKLQKSVNDLEAHINTSIITEKSVRKAADKQLAEELDALRVEINKRK